jgi:HK97 family phage portal protein
MGLFSRIFGMEKRAVPGDAYLGAFLEARAVTGAAVTPDAVLSAMAVATACVSRRSQGLASVPLCIHRNVGTSNAARAEDHPLYDVLNVRPNDYMSAFELREFLVRSHDLFGNAYARIERNARGVVTALHPFMPHMVAIERLVSGRLRYRATDYDGKTHVLLDDEMLHVRGPSRNGMYGLSPIAIARGALGLALAQHETVEALNQNSLRPSGILSWPHKIDTAGRGLIRAQVAEKYQGPRNAGELMILDGGAKYERITFSPEDAELLASRKLANEDVARIFDCPPTSVGIVDRSTYSNTEQEALALVRNCLAPLAARFESAFARCLLTDAGRRSFFFRHDFSELLRGDMKTRFEAYRLAREVGVYSPNDVRRLENEAPIEGGDAYHMPANWIALGAGAPDQGSAAA